MALRKAEETTHMAGAACENKQRAQEVSTRKRRSELAPTFAARMRPIGAGECSGNDVPLIMTTIATQADSSSVCQSSVDVKVSGNTIAMLELIERAVKVVV